MRLSNGKDNFKDGCFSYLEWSAPTLHTPDEVLRTFYELQLKGRVLRSIVAVGEGYNFSDSGIDDYMGHALDALPAEAFAAIPDPDAPLPKGLPLPCRAELDQPLLLCFEGGDVLAIAFDFESSIRMSLNTVPADIHPGINYKNFHANRLFSDLLGKRITAINITFSTQLPRFAITYGLDPSKQTCFVTRLELVFSDDEDHRFDRRLCFYCVTDFGYVELTDQFGEIITFSAERLPWVCEGYLDEYFLTEPSA